MNSFDKWVKTLGTIYDNFYNGAVLSMSCYLTVEEMQAGKNMKENILRIKKEVINE